MFAQEYIERRRSRPSAKLPEPYRLRKPAQRAPPFDPGIVAQEPPDGVEEARQTIQVPTVADILPKLHEPLYTKRDYELAVAGLARLHAPFCGSTDLLAALGMAHPFLKQPLPHLAQRVALSTNDIELLIRRYRSLPSHLQPAPEISEWLFKLLPELPEWRRISGLCCRPTLLHGDARMWNFVIRDVPLSIDAQEVILLKPNFAIGSPALDIALLLTSAWASHNADPPLPMSEAVDIYTRELEEQGCEWLKGEGSVQWLSRAVVIEGVVMMLLHAIDLLETHPDIAGPRYSLLCFSCGSEEHESKLAHRLNHILHHLEPQCRQTISFIQAQMQ